MVFNIPETADENAATRHAADLAHFQSVINCLLESDEPGVELKAITRIGPYTEEGVLTRVRPVKVIFTNPNDPARLLRQRRKLAGKPISVRPDMDAESRAKMQAALEELRVRNNQSETT